MSATETVRLHISPFNSSLYDAIIPIALQDQVSNLSYHTPQNDPDNGFGYLDIAKSEADKLRKKFNGRSLRSKTMSIQEAKPRKRKSDDGAVDLNDESQQQTHTKPNRSKLAHDELAGCELPAGRKVKRAWTDPDATISSKSDKTKIKDKGRQESSKYSRNAELLFRLKDKSKRSSSDDPAKTSKSDRSNVLHEFEKTSKYPSFLRDDGKGRSGGALSFVDGQGWYDEQGKLVEPVNPKRRPPPSVAEPSAKPAALTTAPADDVSTSQPVISSPSVTASQLSSSGSDDDTSDTNSEDSEKVTHSSSPQTINADETLAPDDVKDSLEAENVLETTQAPTVHPLEALYKRDVADGPSIAPIKTSFNFFESDDADDIQVTREPHTPFTRQDLFRRGNRSAAPTPDTAVFASRAFLARGASEENDESDVDDASKTDDGHPTPGSKTLGGTDTHNAEAASDSLAPPESDFEKMFYANRADNNSSWKQRRRDALKANRQRENKRMSRVT